MSNPPPPPPPPKSTIYSASTGEIFKKNFTAGFARALGGIIIYLIFILILTFATSKFLLPKLQPAINNYSNLLNNINQIEPNNNQQLQNIFNQLPNR